MGVGNPEDLGVVEPLTVVVDCLGPTPSLATQLLVVFGFLGIAAWIVNDAAGGDTARVAHVVMVLVFGACLVSGALLLP